MGHTSKLDDKILITIIALMSDQSEWGLCASHHGIQISMEAILACHPARSTE